MISKLILLLTISPIFAWFCFCGNGSEKKQVGEKLNTDSEYYEEEGMVLIKGGYFSFQDEQSTQNVFVSSFLIDAHEVSIAEFEIFVKETGYVPQSDRTDSEAMVLRGRKMHSVKGVNWKCDEKGALRNDKDYPVIYVSFEDAEAYAKWAGKRLPTLYEWLFVAISGTDEQTRWSYLITNSWHTKNTSSLKVGGLKEPNRFGVYDIFGNAGEHVHAGQEGYSSLPPGITKDNVSRAAYSSFFNDPEDILMPRFSIRHRKGIDFYTGFRCAKDILENRP